MPSYDIVLASNIVTNRDGYQHLARIYGSALAQANKDIRIVFNQCSEFESNLAAVLGAILTDLKQKGFRIMLTLPVGMKVRRNLSRCKFLKAFELTSNSLERENYLDYRMFTPEESDEFKAYVEDQLMHKQKFPPHSERAGRLIQESILEIFVNAKDHGKCNGIFCCGEYISSVTPPILNMTIVDRGYTIKRTVNEFLTNKRKCAKSLTACESIRWALEEGNTTKDFPGGLGLTRLKSFIAANRGVMQIVSDNGMVEYESGHTRDMELDTVFEGTIVTMKFNFDSNQNYYIAKEELIDLNNLL